MDAAHKLDQRRRVRVVNRTPRAVPQRAPQVPIILVRGLVRLQQPQQAPERRRAARLLCTTVGVALAYHDTNKRPRLLGVVAVRAPPAPDLGSQHQHVARALRDRFTREALDMVLEGRVEALVINIDGVVFRNGRVDR